MPIVEVIKVDKIKSPFIPLGFSFFISGNEIVTCFIVSEIGRRACLTKGGIRGTSGFAVAWNEKFYKRPPKSIDLAEKICPTISILRNFVNFEISFAFNFLICLHRLGRQKWRQAQNERVPQTGFLVGSTLDFRVLLLKHCNTRVIPSSQYHTPFLLLAKK